MSAPDLLDRDQRPSAEDSPADSPTTPAAIQRRNPARTALIIAAPIALLAALALGLWKSGADWLTRPGAPPIEELAIEWITLRPERFVVRVVNNGPHPVTIAQAMVDEAFWNFTLEPDRPLRHLEQAIVTIPYPWVRGEAHGIRFITDTGATFDATAPVALESPTITPRAIGVFAAIGFLIGVVPVGLGLMWRPALTGLSDVWLRFFLALTVGLLIFLGVDTVHEGWRQAAALPSSFQGVGLLVSLALATFGVLMLLGDPSTPKDESRREKGRRSVGAALAFLVALGIGLHNLGEGLAVGSAYALGEAALGVTLILGFAIHNLTEGLAIAVPVARERVSFGRLATLCAVAGGPTVIGAWVGAFTASRLWAVVFFAVAAGAIFQVIYIIAKSPQMRSESGGKGLLSRPESFAGVAAGLAVMYATGLFAAA